MPLDRIRLKPAFSIAFQTDKPLAAYGELARRAEAAGFGTISVYNDLLYQPSWLPLHEIARSTYEARIGPAAVNPFTSHPINLAANIALIDEASQGRAYLGLARGAWLDTLALEPEGALTALPEAFACIRHLLRQDPAPFRGEHFHLAANSVFRWPIPRPELPFLLGSWGRQTIATCFDHIEEVKLGGTANPRLVTEYRRWIDAHADTSRNSPPALVVGAVTVVDDDPAAARARARREVSLYLPVVADYDPHLGLEPDLLAQIREAAGRRDEESVSRATSDEVLARVTMAGGPEDVAKQAAGLIAAGADRVEFGTPHGLSDERGLELLSTKVLPAL